MTTSLYKKLFLFITIVILLLVCLLPVSISQGIDQNYEKLLNRFNGQILFSPMNSHTTYLIDMDGNVNHTWLSSFTPGQSVYMLDDGVILRTKRLTYNAPGGAGGGVEKISWDGSIIWDFEYYTDDYLSHHDIEPLPNGNILMIAWEYKTYDEAIAAGRDPNSMPGNKLIPDHIIEVEPTGPTSGDIVWEWHVWDHLIQDYDPSKDNYGVVEEHPELVDINFGNSAADWLHTNSIDYNEELDQILISVHQFNEIWVIDHSTTTAEAAGRTGGNSGKGGNLLYRWGNPQAYRTGTTNDRKFFFQHDAWWIEYGCPGEGNILVFNNGVGRPEGMYTSVDEIIPPVDDNGNYSLIPGSAYEPADPIWSYTAENPSDFFSMLYGGAQRLHDGNTLICNGPHGIFFEVTPEMATVWQYVNPYPSPLLNNVFKIYYYETEEPTGSDLDCEGSLSWTEVNPGNTVNGSFKVKNIGESGSLLDWEIESYPDWGTWIFIPESGINIIPEDEPVIIEVEVVAPDQHNREFTGEIRVVNQDDPDDFDVIPVSLSTPVSQNTVYRSYLQFLLKTYSVSHLWI